MRVRRVRPGERAAVGSMTLAAYAPFVGPDDPYAAQLLDVDARDTGAEVWVAVDDDDVPVGSVTVCPPGSAWREVARDDEGELRMLAVAPGQQRRGVGERLTVAVLERFAADGASGVALCSLPAMQGAHRLYERLGFHRDPSRDWAPRPEVPLVAYARSLP